jgi:starvation-inducible DNA-binding protein
MALPPHRSVPGLTASDATQVVSQLTERLVAALDLQLVLKHVHWNVIGPNFISVHEMLDAEVESVRAATDELAERIRTLGGAPRGTAQAIVDGRNWDDYPLDRHDAMRHLVELDKVYDGVIADHRRAIDVVGEVDPVTEDMLIGQTAKLELFQWFIRSFVERAVGSGPVDGEAQSGLSQGPTPAAPGRADGNTDQPNLESAGRH